MAVRLATWEYTSHIAAATFHWPLQQPFVLGNSLALECSAGRTLRPCKNLPLSNLHHSGLRVHNVSHKTYMVYLVGI